jgi:hypothetical protein
MSYLVVVEVTNYIVYLCVYLITFYVIQYGLAISAVTTMSCNETLETNLAKASSIELNVFRQVETYAMRSMPS